MGAKTEPLRPAQIVAQRVRERREELGWSQADLAERLREIGYDKSRSTLTKLEGGRYRNVSVDDLFALSAALGWEPTRLVTPRKDAAVVAVAPRLRFPATLVRGWLRGVVQLPLLPDVDVRETLMPQLVPLLAALLARDMPPLTRALAQDALSESARKWAEQIINPPEEGEDDDGDRH